MVERSDQLRVTATFFCPETFAAGGHVTLGDDSAQHARVLRIGPGETVELRNGAGGAARGVLSRMTKRSLYVDVLDIWTIAAPPEVHMLVPVGDRDRMLMLAEKATELGAASWHSPAIEAGPADDGHHRLRSIGGGLRRRGAPLPAVGPHRLLARGGGVAAAPALPHGRPLLAAGAGAAAVDAVGATDNTNTIASYSSRGPSACDGSIFPHVVAPGSGINTAAPTSFPDLYTHSSSGTSFAAPHVAGAVALLWSCAPGLTGQIDATFQLLQSSADPAQADSCGAPTSAPRV